MKVFKWLAAFAFSFTASVQGQVVAIFDGNTYTQDGNGNITVPVGTLTTDKLIRVYDPNSSTTMLPSASLASLTVSGSASSSAKLRLFVASADTTTFPSVQDVGSRIAAGIVHLGTPDLNGGAGTGGIFFVDENGNHNPDLQRASIVAISASGNIHGEIQAGRVFRMQATNAALDNEITANVFAIAEDVIPSDGGLVPIGNMSIGVITAGACLSRGCEATGWGECEMK